jgi:hypothetical protein
MSRSTTIKPGFLGIQSQGQGWAQSPQISQLVCLQAAASEVSTTFRFTMSFLVQPVYNCLAQQPGRGPEDSR